MKINAFTVSIATMLAGSAASAGGYIAPVVEEIVPIVEPAPALTWKGAYVGATVGYAFNGDDEVGYAFDDNVFATPETLEISGANAGIRAGYRTQFTGRTREWVIGGELSYEGGNIDDSFDNGTYSAENSINSVIALRMKTGVLNAAGNTLFYGIVGVAQADYDYEFAGLQDDIAFSAKTDGETATGYIVGLGVERKLNERLSVTGEWEYANFGKETLKSDDGLYSTQMTSEFHNIKIGLNYQF